MNLNIVLGNINRFAHSKQTTDILIQNQRKLLGLQLKLKIIQLRNHYVTKKLDQNYFLLTFLEEVFSLH